MRVFAVNGGLLWVVVTTFALSALLAVLLVARLVQLGHKNGVWWGPFGWQLRDKAFRWLIILFLISDALFTVALLMFVIG